MSTADLDVPLDLLTEAETLRERAENLSALSADAAASLKVLNGAERQRAVRRFPHHHFRSMARFTQHHDVEKIYRDCILCARRPFWAA